MLDDEQLVLHASLRRDNGCALTEDTLFEDLRKFLNKLGQMNQKAQRIALQQRKKVKKMPPILGNNIVLDAPDDDDRLWLSAVLECGNGCALREEVLREELRKFLQKVSQKNQKARRGNVCRRGVRYRRTQREAEVHMLESKMASILNGPTFPSTPSSVSTVCDSSDLAEFF